MGIKRLKKIFVITGGPNTGKTRCIKQIARMFWAENFDYMDLLHTRYGEFLNLSPSLDDMNDDIFGYFSTPLDRVGILSAGDNEVLIEVQLQILLTFQPDVIVCAAHDKQTIESFFTGKKYFYFGEIDKTLKDALPDDRTQRKLLQAAENDTSESIADDNTKKNLLDVRNEIVDETNISEIFKHKEDGETTKQDLLELTSENAIEDLFKKIESAIRGF